MPAAKSKSAPKSAAKKATVKKPSAKKVSGSHQKSFKLASPATSFFTFRLSIQSAYWFILCALVLALGAWVLYLSMKVEAIYDQIEISNAVNSSIVLPAKHPTAK